MLQGHYSLRKDIYHNLTIAQYHTQVIPVLFEMSKWFTKKQMNDASQKIIQKYYSKAPQSQRKLLRKFKRHSKEILEKMLVCAYLMMMQGQSQLILDRANEYKEKFQRPKPLVIHKCKICNQYQHRNKKSFGKHVSHCRKKHQESLGIQRQKQQDHVFVESSSSDNSSEMDILSSPIEERSGVQHGEMFNQCEGFPELLNTGPHSFSDSEMNFIPNGDDNEDYSPI